MALARYLSGTSGFFRRKSAVAPGTERGFRLGVKKTGQVTVELMLVLPVFMLMLFFIMELGNLAYQTILVHHCAYELARIGSLVAGPPGGSERNNSNVAMAEQKMRHALTRMFKRSRNIKLNARAVVTSLDPQPLASPNPRTHINEDLQVTLVYPATLIFPGSSYFLADTPRRLHRRKITVKVRMPIEKPVFQ